jgi:hypothetical protein
MLLYDESSKPPSTTAPMAAVVPHSTATVLMGVNFLQMDLPHRVKLVKE